MNRSNRLAIVVGIAVVTATLASAGVYTAIQRRPVITAETPSAYAVVAARALELGRSLRAEDVKRIAWPARHPVAGSFSTVEDVVNRGLVAPAAENELITESKLAPLHAGSGLPLAIRTGMRAMSVKVNEVIGVAGFVVPGTKVDVLVTIHRASESISRVVVSNVQVLTAGTRYDEVEAKKEGKPIPSSVVTLMVHPGDAERIALAATEGQIMLALRHPLDTQATETEGTSTTSLLRAPVSRNIPEARPPARAVQKVAAIELPAHVPPPAHAVETIRAGKRETETLR